MNKYEECQRREQKNVDAEGETGEKLKWKEVKH